MDCRSVARVDRLISDVSGRAAADTRPPEGNNILRGSSAGFICESVVCLRTLPVHVRARV